MCDLHNFLLSQYTYAYEVKETTDKRLYSRNASQYTYAYEVKGGHCYNWHASRACRNTHMRMKWKTDNEQFATWSGSRNTHMRMKWNVSNIIQYLRQKRRNTRVRMRWKKHCAQSCIAICIVAIHACVWSERCSHMSWNLNGASRNTRVCVE